MCQLLHLGNGSGQWNGGGIRSVRHGSSKYKQPVIISVAPDVAVALDVQRNLVLPSPTLPLVLAQRPFSASTSLEEGSHTSEEGTAGLTTQQ